MNTQTIEKYFSGESTKEDETEILNYFESDTIDVELLPYQNYFKSMSALRKDSKLIIPKSDYENFTVASRNRFHYILRYGIGLAVAASVALFVIFSPFWHKNNDFVVINGKKYTDKKHIELALSVSLENVKLDVHQIFEDFDNDLFN